MPTLPDVVVPVPEVPPVVPPLVPPPVEPPAVPVGVAVRGWPLISQLVGVVGPVVPGAATKPKATVPPTGRFAFQPAFFTVYRVPTCETTAPSHTLVRLAARSNCTVQSGTVTVSLLVSWICPWNPLPQFCETLYTGTTAVSTARPSRASTPPSRVRRRARSRARSSAPWRVPTERRKRSPNQDAKRSMRDEALMSRSSERGIRRHRRDTSKPRPGPFPAAADRCAPRRRDGDPANVPCPRSDFTRSRRRRQGIGAPEAWIAGSVRSRVARLAFRRHAPRTGAAWVAPVGAARISPSSATSTPPL